MDMCFTIMLQYYYEDDTAMLMDNTMTTFCLLFYDMYIDVIMYEKMGVCNFRKSVDLL